MSRGVAGVWEEPNQDLSCLEPCLTVSKHPLPYKPLFERRSVQPALEADIAAPQGFNGCDLYLLAQGLGRPAVVPESMQSEQHDQSHHREWLSGNWDHH